MRIVLAATILQATGALIQIRPIPCLVKNGDVRDLKA